MDTLNEGQKVASMCDERGKPAAGNIRPPDLRAIADLTTPGLTAGVCFRAWEPPIGIRLWQQTSAAANRCPSEQMGMT